jgi:SAM-dependent methyltransferase
MKCPVCASSKNAVVETFGEFKIRDCSDCALQFADPLRYDTANYEQAYARQDSSKPDFYVPAMRWLAESSPDLREFPWFLFSAQWAALRWLGNNVPVGEPLLDLGCGSGWFLAALKAHGYRAMGAEIGIKPVEILQQRGFTVACGSIESIPSDWPRPAAVTMFEVLEHLPDPLGMLRSIREHFPSAKLVISVPSPTRWTKRGAHRDPADFPPNHLTRWNVASLRHALELAGYTNAAVEPSRPTNREFSAVGIQGWLLDRKRADMADRMADAIVPTRLRSLHSEIRARKKKAILGAALVPLFLAKGWSGISLLATAG